jgi:starch phosphorylase
MGILALRNSNGRNAVSELHGQVSRKMWHFLWGDAREEDVPITHVTNGVHTANWMARRLKNLFVKYLGSDWYEHLDEADFWSKIDDIPRCRVVGCSFASETQAGILSARARP